MPGWSGPAGSSLQRNGSYATKAESFSFAKPNLQLQLFSRSRSSRPWETKIQSPTNSGNRRSSRSHKTKSSRRKQQQQKQQQQTPLERWQSETETIIKRLNQIRIQQGNTLRSEQESKKGKEISREKKRWKELMQREHKREMKMLKREAKVAYSSAR